MAGDADVVLITEIENDLLFPDGKKFWMGKNSSHLGVLH